MNIQHYGSDLVFASVMAYTLHRVNSLEKGLDALLNHVGVEKPRRKKLKALATIGGVGAAMLAAHLLCGCTSTRMHAERLGTNEAVTVTMRTLFDGKNTADKVRGTVGKTLSVGGSGLEQESNSEVVKQVIDGLRIVGSLYAPVAIPATTPAARPSTNSPPP